MAKKAQIVAVPSIIPEWLCLLKIPITSWCQNLLLSIISYGHEQDYFFIGLLGPLRVRALVRVRCPWTGNPRR